MVIIKAFILLLLIFTLATPVSAAPFYDLPTAAQFLVGDLLSQLEPIETEILRLFDEDVILDVGQRDGVRPGQIFEIYSSSTLNI